MVDFYYARGPVIDAGIWFKPFEITMDDVRDLPREEFDQIERLPYRVPGMQANFPLEFDGVWARFRARPCITTLAR